MPFAVKAVGVPSGLFWTTAQSADAKRGLSKRRDDAAKFTTPPDAQDGMTQASVRSREHDRLVADYVGHVERGQEPCERRCEGFVHGRSA
jgi:hypothetical protein